MGARKYTHNTEIECPPLFSLTIFCLQQTAGAAWWCRSIFSTEISDKQTSQAESECVACSKISQ